MQSFTSIFISIMLLSIIYIHFENKKTDVNYVVSKVDKRKGAEYKAEATIAAALHNLASCMLQNNKPKEAYENYRTSLNLKQVVFENENHPEIALTLHHMAEALLLLERIEDAIVVLERSVKITDAVGIGHTPTAFRRMRRLCQLYEIKKRFDSFDEDIKHWNDYDYIIINKNLDVCFKQIENIILSKKNKEII